MCFFSIILLKPLAEGKLSSWLGNLWRLFPFRLLDSSGDDSIPILEELIELSFLLYLLVLVTRSPVMQSIADDEVLEPESAVSSFD